MDDERRLLRHSLVFLLAAGLWQLTPPAAPAWPVRSLAPQAAVFISVVLAVLASAWRLLSLSEALKRYAAGAAVTAGHVGVLGFAVTEAAAWWAPPPDAFLSPEVPAWISGLRLAAGLVMVVGLVASLGVAIHGLRRTVP